MSASLKLELTIAFYQIRAITVPDVIGSVHFLLNGATVAVTNNFPYLIGA